MATPMMRLQQALQSVVQSVQWTYSLFWQVCPQKGELVWGDGYYNGEIKTRKTVQPTEVSTEEAALQRSKQLRELYDSLSTAEAADGQPAQRRPCAALSPEDLTESEWFYLMCVSYSFPPGVGLPGRAYEIRRHAWLTGANEADSKVFSRTILAKSACIQTVVCIPVMDGVLELGTTDKVEEYMGLIQHAKSFFPEQHEMHIIMPAISEQSTSNPISSYNDSHPQFIPHQMIPDPNNHDLEDENIQTNKNQVGNFVTGESSELMQLEMSEAIRLGSPEDCSNNFEEELQMLGVCQEYFLNEDLSCDFPQASAAMQDLSPENAHYSETVSIILQHNSNSNFISNFSISPNSNFTWWNSKRDIDPPPLIKTNSQSMLKRVLIDVPNMHCNSKDGGNSDKSKDEGGNCNNKYKNEELSANHVLAERRRREKLNERFIILRSLVPFVTKMDKASILGDTIEYVKQLLKRIQELESQLKQKETNQRLKPNSKSKNPILLPENQKSKNQIPLTDVQVSIIESDALVELQCPNKEGLFLKIMQTISELRLEVISVHSSVDNNNIFLAEFRAKVKDANGKRASILEVKKALHRILPLQ